MLSNRVLKILIFKNKKTTTTFFNNLDLLQILTKAPQLRRFSFFANSKSSSVKKF